jgi:hypothetical protein
MCIKYAHSKVLEENIMVFLEDSNILGESQGAFRRELSPEPHISKEGKTDPLSILCQTLSTNLRKLCTFLIWMLYVMNKYRRV